MYVYGGFALDCTTACTDLWAYEISYGPYNFYPRHKDPNKWYNFGNHWNMVNDGVNYGPGPRWRNSMVTHQAYPNAESTRNEHFIYIFGGIMVQDERLVREILLTTNETNVSSYAYKGDLWRYDLTTNQWEEVEVFGIATVKR